MTDFSKTKDQFYLPQDTIYLDGNSLGPMPIAAAEKLDHVTRLEWGELLIRGWNDANWFNQPAQLGDRLASMLGAASNTIVLGDTLSIKVYQALAAALEIATHADRSSDAQRKIILSDTGNFPTDLYMTQSLIRTMQSDHELKLVEPEEIFDTLNENIAVLMLTQVDYRTGRLHDMQKITAKAHEFGIVTLWDLAHSAGALPVDLAGAKADFAVGCTYKYLNAGPGSPAFIYVDPQHQEKITPALSGWLGHDKPFAFELDYRAGPAINRMRVGTPPILQFAALEAALDVWQDVSIDDVRKKSIELSELFIKKIEDDCPALTLASPRDPEQRGSQVSFSFQDGYAAMKAIIERGVIGDFREPDIMRFAITPLYINERDVTNGARIIANVVNSGIWQDTKYQQKGLVT